MRHYIRNIKAATFHIITKRPSGRTGIPVSSSVLFPGEKRIMILPVVKLGTLALKTACKPIASKLKKEAGKHPKFRQFIVRIAQANHRITTTIQRRIYGHATNVEIRPLNEEKAVHAASELIGELFVFSVATVALIYEVQRSAKSEAKKEEARRQELEAMKQRESDLEREVEALKKKVEEIEQLARGRGLSGILSFWSNGHARQASEAATPA